MLYLIYAPTTSDLDARAIIASGSGLDWSVESIPRDRLRHYALQKAKFENVQVKLLSGNEKAPNQKDKLIYSEEGQTRIWIDTAPMSSSRLTSHLAVVVQEIQTEAGFAIGYVVVFPDGRVLRVAADDFLKYCETARVRGKLALQNMQYVSANGSTAAHLKNYENRLVPRFILRRAPANAEIAPHAPEPAPSSENKPSSAFTAAQLKVLARGKKEGVDIRVYANPAFSPKRMDIIRKVLLQHKNPTPLLDLTLPEDLMVFYGLDLTQGADIRAYFNKAYTVKQAIQVKLGFIRGLDVSQYADPAVDADEMEQRRVRLDADMWSGII